MYYLQSSRTFRIRSPYSDLHDWQVSNDNYTNYFIGFDNGAYAADKENQHSTVYYHDNCGTDHTNEYCVGFKAGWNYEANALGPPQSASNSNVTPTASKV